MNFAHIIVLLAFVLCPSVSAHSLTNVNIAPAQNILSGDMITASFTLKPSPYENYTFNPNGTIQLSTTLENAQWTRITVLDSVQSKQQVIQGKTVNLNGWDLAYPNDYSILLNFTLTGNAPVVRNTSECTIIGIGEYIQSGLLLGGSTKLDKIVISSNDLESNIHLAETDLKILRTAISNATKNGFDTSGAGTLYKNAQSGIDFAKSLPPEKYLSGLSRLKTVKTDISDGINLLEREWTQAEIDRTSKEKSQADKIIRWFISRYPDYPGFRQLEKNWSNTAGTISDATSAMNAGRYEQARAQAQAGFIQANQTVTEAQRLQKRAQDPLTPLWDNFWIVYALLGIVVLFLLFRKKKRRKPVKKDGKNGTGQESKSVKAGDKTSADATGRASAGKSKVQQSGK